MPDARPTRPQGVPAAGPHGTISGRPATGEVFETVSRCVTEVLEVDAADVNPDARFAEDLSANSLTLIEVMMAFEEAFGIEVREADVAGVATVGDACALVSRLLEQ